MTMTDLRRARSDTTRQTLLRRAAELFATAGYDGTTLDALAREAGVNKALVQYHFGGKQGLYSEVLRQAIAIGIEEMSPVRDRRAPADERLADYVDALQRFLKRAPHFAFIVIREEMGGGLRLEKDVLEAFLQFFALDREIIEQGVREGVFRRVDPHQTHLSLVGSIVFFLVSQPLRDSPQRMDFPGNRPALDAYVEHVKTLFLTGLRK